MVQRGAQEIRREPMFSVEPISAAVPMAWVLGLAACGRGSRSPGSECA